MLKIYLGILLSCLFLFSNSYAQSSKVQTLLKQLLDLPAPAPRSLNENAAAPKRERDAEFLSDDKVPPDDAPIEDLIDYWANQSGKYSRITFTNKPSARTVERLLEYCENKPEAIYNFLNILPAKPEIAEKVKRFYDQMPDEGEESYQREAVNNWLKMNSRYYLDELIRKAQKIRDQNNYIQSGDQDILRALARVDWDNAKIIIDRLMSDSTNPYSAVLAKWVAYEHAMETGDTSTAESYRRDLQKIVEDKNAPWAMRDLAMDALVLSGEWDGRDDWYISLLEDETLLAIQDNGYTGLTTLISVSKPGKYRDAMIRLTKSSNIAVRSAAVRNLLSSNDRTRPEVLEALLPWLTNPNWIKAANEGQRFSLISLYGEVLIPAAVPGLIWIVQNEKELNRAYAALALTKYKDSLAVPALRAALAEEKNIEYRKYIIGALIASNGISDDEQMSSLEAYCEMVSTPQGAEKFQKYEYNYAEEDLPPLPVAIIIGKYVADQEEPSEGLAVRAIERLKVLRRTKPPTAQILAGIMKKWKGRIVFLELIRQISAGEGDVDTVLNLLANRKDSREKIPNELNFLRGSNGIGRGFAACIAEEEQDFLGILRTSDVEAQTAMFACARLIRAKVPLDAVSRFLTHQNALLALSAERYLEAEDSVEARKMVLAKNPNEILILGAQYAFIPRDVKNPYESEALNLLFASVNEYYYGGNDLPDIKKSENNLREEMRQNPDLIVVYAIVPNAKSGQKVVRVFKDRVVFTHYEDEARYWERTLKNEEYQTFLEFIIQNNIDSFTPFYGECERCQANEFLMFGRSGGRRVFFESYDAYYPQKIDKLVAAFDKLSEGEMRLNYWLTGKIGGLEVLLADKKFGALAVWKKENDFRVLVADNVKQAEIEKELAELEKQENAVEIDDNDYEKIQARYLMQQKRRMQMQYSHLAWRKVSGGKIGEPTTQPAEMPYLFDETQIAEFEGIRFLPRAWQVRAGNTEIRVGDDYYENGIFRVSRPQKAVKLRDGTYNNPIVAANGKWVVVSKADSDWSEPNSVVRINLQTGKELKINILPADTLMPIAFIASQNKVLIYRRKGKFYMTDTGISEIVFDGEHDYQPPASDKPNPSPAMPEFYLLDAETGIAQLVKGEFRPFLQQTYRPLQPTGTPNEFWAAIYDEKTRQTQIGRYNDKTFKFTPVRAIPDINLNSMQIWIEEKEAKIYFVYQGHLLSLPLS